MWFIGQYFVWMEGSEALFRVGGGEWECIGHYFGCVGVGGKIFWVGGDEWVWVSCLIMLDSNTILKFPISKGFSVP